MPRLADLPTKTRDLEYMLGQLPQSRMADAELLKQHIASEAEKGRITSSTDLLSNESPAIRNATYRLKNTLSQYGFPLKEFALGANPYLRRAREIYESMGIPARSFNRMNLNNNPLLEASHELMREPGAALEGFRDVRKSTRVRRALLRFGTGRGAGNIDFQSFLRAHVGDGHEEALARITWERPREIKEKNARVKTGARRGRPLKNATDARRETGTAQSDGLPPHFAGRFPGIRGGYIPRAKMLYDRIRAEAGKGNIVTVRGLLDDRELGPIAKSLQNQLYAHGRQTLNHFIIAAHPDIPSIIDIYTNSLGIDPKEILKLNFRSEMVRLSLDLLRSKDPDEVWNGVKKDKKRIHTIRLRLGAYKAGLTLEEFRDAHFRGYAGTAARRSRINGGDPESALRLVGDMLNGDQDAEALKAHIESEMAGGRITTPSALLLNEKIGKRAARVQYRLMKNNATLQKFIIAVNPKIRGTILALAGQMGGPESRLWEIYLDNSLFVEAYRIMHGGTPERTLAGILGNAKTRHHLGNVIRAYAIGKAPSVSAVLRGIAGDDTFERAVGLLGEPKTRGQRMSRTKLGGSRLPGDESQRKPTATP